jgi:hypothetical protein
MQRQTKMDLTYVQSRESEGISGDGEGDDDDGGGGRSLQQDRAVG